MSFVSDLKVWEDAQKEFAKVLMDKTKVIGLEFAQGKFKDWDIKANIIPEGITTYEVKTDLKASETNNFVIEYRYKWKASWIFSSKADYIVYYIKWQRRIQDRWELILRLMDTEKRDTKGWDGFFSSLWVISCDNLPNLFNLIENGQTEQSNSDSASSVS